MLQTEDRDFQRLYKKVEMHLFSTESRDQKLLLPAAAGHDMTGVVDWMETESSTLGKTSHKCLIITTKLHLHVSDLFSTHWSKSAFTNMANRCDCQFTHKRKICLNHDYNSFKMQDIL